MPNPSGHHCCALHVDVIFICFDVVRNGIPSDIDVIINAGYEGSAWSGSDCWNDPKVLENLTKWIHEGGAFIGVNESSACRGGDTLFRMAHVLGIDNDPGKRVCHGKWAFEPDNSRPILTVGSSFKAKENLYLTDANATVLAKSNGIPTATINRFGKGTGA